MYSKLDFPKRRSSGLGFCAFVLERRKIRCRTPCWDIEGRPIFKVRKCCAQVPAGTKQLALFQKSAAKLPVQHLRRTNCAPCCGGSHRESNYREKTIQKCASSEADVYDRQMNPPTQADPALERAESWDRRTRIQKCPESVKNWKLLDQRYLLQKAIITEHISWQISEKESKCRRFENCQRPSPADASVDAAWGDKKIGESHTSALVESGWLHKYEQDRK